MVWVPEDLGLIGPQGWSPWPLVGELAPRLRISASVPVGSQTSGILKFRSNIEGLLNWVLTDSVITPAEAQIAAGQDHTGAAAVKSGTAGMPPQTETNTQTGLTVGETYYVHGYVASSDIEIDDTPIASLTYFQGVFPAVLGFSLSSPPVGYELTINATSSQGDDLGWVAFAGSHTPPTEAQVLAGSVGDYSGSFTTAEGSETAQVTENAETFTVYVATENSVALVSPVLSDTQLVSDVVAPEVTVWAVDSDETTDSSITVDFEVDEDGDIYTLVTLQADAAPTKATIIAANNTTAAIANTPGTVTFGSLGDNTAYRFSTVAVDPAGNESDVAEALETTDEASATPYLNLTYAQGNPSNYYRTGPADWNNWYSNGGNESVVFGVVGRIRNLVNDAGDMWRRPVAGTGIRGILDISNKRAQSQVSTALGNNGGLLISGFYANEADENTFLVYHGANATGLQSGVDDRFYSQNVSSVLPLSIAGPTDTDRARFPSTNMFDIACFFVVKANTWTDVEADAFMAELKAGSRLWPVQATSAWHFHELPAGEGPATLSDVIGSGPDMIRVGTVTLTAPITPTWEP